MQVVYHLGAHCTDEDRLLRSLLKNKGPLAAQGCIVPGPSRYRQLLRQTILQLKGNPASAAAQEALLDAMGDQDSVERLILSHEHFLCLPTRIVSDQGLYPGARNRAAALRNLFPEAETTFMIALRGMATFLPAILGRLEHGDYATMMGEATPDSLSWVPVVRALRIAAPEARLIVWCDEDTPLLWPQLMRLATGLAADFVFQGDIDLTATLMTQQGLARLTGYFARHPARTDADFARVISAFLDRFGLPGAFEISVPLPGWTDATVAAADAAYHRDLTTIAGMAGVDLILP